MCHKRRVRFAPSPTGPPYILGEYGQHCITTYMPNSRGVISSFVLKIPILRGLFLERKSIYRRHSTGLASNLMKAPRKGGSYGPYKQSQRREIYKEHVKLLLEKGAAYIAFDTPEELDAKRSEIPNFQYDASTRNNMRNSLTLTEKETDLLIKSGMQYVVRIKIEPDNEIIVDDMIRGKVAINSSVVDDKVIYKSSDELPTYHLANVVDDHLMEITHVIRGEEWLPSAPLHVWLYKSLAGKRPCPRFAHLPPPVKT